MLTKKQLARLIFLDHAESEKMKVEDIKPGEIFKNSSLAVAMEYLGMLDEDLATYASERGGSVLSQYDMEADELLYLSTRDLFKLLPE